GFVIEIKTTTNVKQLKRIIKPLDLTPVLNKELLQLGHWLAEETLCFKISALQAMLPAGMKVKYGKKLRMIQAEPPPALQALFDGKKEMAWKEAEAKGVLPQLQKEVKNGNVEVAHIVKHRANKKINIVISHQLSKKELKAC